MKQFNFKGITVTIFVRKKQLKIVTFFESTEKKLNMTANYALDETYCLNRIGTYITNYLMKHIGYINADLLYIECFKIHQEKKLIK